MPIRNVKTILNYWTEGFSGIDLDVFHHNFYT